MYDGAVRQDKRRPVGFSKIPSSRIRGKTGSARHPMRCLWSFTRSDCVAGLFMRGSASLNSRVKLYTCCRKHDLLPQHDQAFSLRLPDSRLPKGQSGRSRTGNPYELGGAGRDSSVFDEGHGPPLTASQFAPIGPLCRKAPLPSRDSRCRYAGSPRIPGESSVPPRSHRRSASHEKRVR